MVVVCTASVAAADTQSSRSQWLDRDSIVITVHSGAELDQQTAQSPSAQAEAVPYGDLIDRAAAAHGVAARLLRALIKVESNFREHAHSRKGAMGLMQLTRATARRFGVRDPYNPQQNIEGGTKYLRTLLDRFPSTSLALAAYNAGEGAVDRFGGIPPYAETRDYVTRILQISEESPS